MTETSKNSEFNRDEKSEENNKQIKDRILEDQYVRAHNDARYFDQATWQIPSIALTVTSVIIVASFYYLGNFLFPSAVLLGFGGFFTLALSIVITKLRINNEVRLVFLEKIERDIGLAKIPRTNKEMEEFLYEMVREQHDHQTPHRHVIPSIFRRQSAVRWVFYSMIFLSLILFLMCIYQSMNGICHYFQLDDQLCKTLIQKSKP